MIKPAAVAPETENENIKQDKLPPGKILIPKPDSHAVADLMFNDIEIWERYESAYCAFVSHGVYPAKLKRPFTEADVGKELQDTIVDFSTAFALQGSDYIGEIQMNLQYTVLQSALILTISMPLYIEPPEFASESRLRIFSAVMGLAAFLQLITIIGCTIVSSFFNRAYADSDAMVSRVKANSILFQVNIWNYMASFATIAAMLIAGFSRSRIDGVIHLYIGVLAIVLIIMFVGSMKAGALLQDVRAFQFYQQYCDPETGRLKDEYLKQVYAKRHRRLAEALKKSKQYEYVNESNCL